VTKHNRTSKHRTHVRKGRWAKRIGARAISNPAGTKLLKSFAKVHKPRGY
jgi:hypothetical protein